MLLNNPSGVLQDLPPTRPSAAAARSSWPTDQSAGPPTTWDADSRLADDSFLRDPTSPRGCLLPTTDGRDRCLRRTNDDVLRTRNRPGPVGKQAMTRCLLRRGPPALHAIDGSSIAVPHTPLPCCLLVTYTAWQPKTEQKGFKGQASVSPSRTCTMSLSASCWLRLEMRARCPKAKTAGDARPHCTHHHHRHHVVCSAGVV